jgi:hypothetical protein
MEARTIELLADNIPPPEDASLFNERLKKEFGSIGSHQRVRVVWGMDTSLKQWVGGKYILKYPSACIRERRHLGYVCDGKVYPPNTDIVNIDAKPGSIVLPLYDNIEKYIGYPAWIVECYYPPDYFGTPEAWHAERLRQKEQFGVDVLGPYPADGAYLEGVKLVMTNADGEMIARPLSDETFDIICGMVRGEERGVKAFIEMKTLTEDELWQRAVNEIFDSKEIHSAAAPITKSRHSVNLPGIELQW